MDQNCVKGFPPQGGNIVVVDSSDDEDDGFEIQGLPQSFRGQVPSRAPLSQPV